MANSTESFTRHPKLKLAAPLWHTLGLLMIQLAISLSSMDAEPWPGSSRAASRKRNPLSVCDYFGMGIVLLCVAWRTYPRCNPRARLCGRTLEQQEGCAARIGIAAGFWVLVTAVAVSMNYALGPSHLESLGFLTPRGVAEVTLWVMMSATAGFCEELVYRGYLQRQFLALTGSAALAVLVQAILFGIAHWYQGVKMMIVITVLGILFGILAHWRKSLRPGIIAHAWGDIVNLIAICFP